MDSELEQAFGDVGSLPTMVTPVCDLGVTPVECPVIEHPGVSVVVTRWSGFLIHRRGRWVSCQCLGRLR